MPPVGKWVVLQDPQGAVFAAFTPSRAPTAPEHPVELGDFSWHELATSDWKAAFEFYKKLFGWQETSAMDMGPDLGMYQMYGRGGAPLGGIYNKPKNAPGPSAWLPYIRVTDARTTPAATKKGGGQVINGPLEVPGGDWITMAMDPQGAPFATHSVKPVEQAKVVKTAKTVKKAKTAKKAKVVKKAKASKPARKAKVVKKAKGAGKAKRGKQGKRAKGAKKAARAAKKTRRATSRRR
jgi:predicted enzyme related to lactoylglutathione lyase